jgi:hypothetical protein
LRYFVIAPDGSRYGPADLNTLKAWVAQGRITPDTILEEEASRQRVPARMVAGLFAAEGPGSVPPVGQPMYPRRVETGRGAANDGTVDVFLSYACSAMSILCCGLFLFGAFMYASRAISKGNRGGYAARIVAIFFTVLYCVSSILMVMFWGQIQDLLTQRFGIDIPGPQ